MRIGVLTFPGSLDDVDAARAVRLAGGEPVALWHADHDLKDVDAVVLPGGFSYGDYLRAGAIAARAPLMQDVVARANEGMPVLGICNGFQVLCEAGLLPGALTRNSHLHFRNRDQVLRRRAGRHRLDRRLRRRPARSSSRSRTARAATSPPTPTSTGSRARAGSCSATSTATRTAASRDIAGVTSENGRVVGLMPHPEHAVEDLTGPAPTGSASSPAS